MLYREFQPQPSLRRDVKLIWVLETESPAPEPQRILPDGIVEVGFHYGAPYESRFEGDPWCPQARSFVATQTKRYLEIRPTGPSGFIAIRFYPWGARRFFRAPVSELSERILPADAIWGKAARDLTERVGNASSTSERLERVERFLLARYDERELDVVDRGSQFIWRRHGQLSVRALCEELGSGERTLERRFREGTGTTPKRMARLVRFLSACRSLKSERYNLAGLAHDSGYHDQAHFIKECRAFSGLTPGQLLTHEELSFFEL